MNIRQYAAFFFLGLLIYWPFSELPTGWGITVSSEDIQLGGTRRPPLFACPRWRPGKPGYISSMAADLREQNGRYTKSLAQLGRIGVHPNS